MTFSTLTFFVFVTLVFALYWLVRTQRGQNLVLLAASYAFYGWWDYRFCALLLGSSLADFFIARALERKHDEKLRRRLLGLSVTLNLGLLGTFKYFNFFVESFGELLQALGLSANLPSLTLILPVGISFYTFQTLGYSIDVYRREMKSTPSLLNYLTYVSFFPQLVAGPIERARRFLPQLESKRDFDDAEARDGLKLFLWGWSKKIIIADNLGALVEVCYAGQEPGPVLLLGTVAFAFQIYYDFSGYSDMAIGTAKLFGLRLVRNFAYPYFSQSVGEFWRRWHMSLSTWFRDYVYVPLGGSRHGRARLWVALLATFTLSGLWHGASWTFVVWGAANGLFVGLSMSSPRTRDKLGPDEVPPPVLVRDEAGLRVAWPVLARMLRTFALICATWVFFRAETLHDALGMLGRIVLDAFDPAAWARVADYNYFVAGFGPLLFIFVWVEWTTRDREHPLGLSHWPRVGRWTLYTILIWTIIYLSPDKSEAFIYFQF